MPVIRRLEGSLTADRRLYADASGKIVEADDPTRATLVAAAGTTVAPEVVERHGLTSKDGVLSYPGYQPAKQEAEGAASATDASAERERKGEASSPADAEPARSRGR